METQIQQILKLRRTPPKECEGCITKTYCYIKKSARKTCPCIDCLIKSVCKTSCAFFNRYEGQCWG